VDMPVAQVLDVGCGGGLLAEGMARQGAQVTGIDRSPKALGIARLHAEKAGIDINYVESDAESWAEEHAESYDVVTCLEVLEHVPDVPRTIQACCTMLKPGGLFFFATLNRTVQSYVKAIIGAEYVLGWLPRGTHQYDKFIRPSELHVACQRGGLDVLDVCGISYRFMADNFELSDDVSVNYLGRARRVA